MPLNKPVNCPTRRKRGFMDFHGAPPDLEIQAATYLQGGITPGFEVLAMTAAVGIVSVFRITLSVLWARLATPSPSLRGHDMPDQGLDGPIVVLQIKGKMIKELPVKRNRSL